MTAEEVAGLIVMVSAAVGFFLVAVGTALLMWKVIKDMLEEDTDDGEEVDE